VEQLRALQGKPDSQHLYYNRTDWPIEHAINFTDFNLQGAFDNNSVRVIEFNSTTNTSSEVVSQFDKDEDYDNATNAYGPSSGS
jgi:hypothetical protein